MTVAEEERDFYREHDLSAARRLGTNRQPAAHQAAALLQLGRWYDSRPFPEAGGVLALPTGGGKTYTAVRFLCQRALSDGYKVLWLAHTHHLLEQAFDAFDDGVSRVAEPRATIRARVVSGTREHYPVHQIEATDDVVVGTLQSIGKAMGGPAHPSLEAFLSAAGEKLFVVFDEAHHSPARSYRNLIFGLRERFREMYLLGLTATPTYGDESKRGWLKKVFPQGIIHQVRAESLLAAQVLARPIFEAPTTAYEPVFDDRDYQVWLGTHRDLPEDVISQLARSRERNQTIAAHYAENREKYGKTLVFADRWHQCEQISEYLKARGVRTGTVYSHVDTDPGSAEARNRRKSDENAIELRKFKDGHTDVLLNVRMLTEGTDVPDVQTVFLTRSTTSRILHTQMVGRALRGPKFGGTDTAYIVSFVDIWKHLIDFAEYDELGEGGADDRVVEYGERPPLQLISIDLVRRLARLMDTGVNMNPGPFVSMLPLGWYAVEYQAQVEGTEDSPSVREMVMVFESQAGQYAAFVQDLLGQPLESLAADDLKLDAVRDRVDGWIEAHFPDPDEHYGTGLARDLFRVARHVAQSGEAPRFFPFELRKEHDLDVLAERTMMQKLDRFDEHREIMAEYHRVDRFWSSLYYHPGLFKTHYDACVNRLMDAREHGALPDKHRPVIAIARPVVPPMRDEPSEATKEMVKRRDNRKCLCCGVGKPRPLRVDHVRPRYYGGGNSMANLQTLCVACNTLKGTEDYDFRTDETRLTQPPATSRVPDPPTGEAAKATEEWETYVRRYVNMFFRCAAVDQVDIGKKGGRFHDWRVRLRPGNDPSWASTVAEAILRDAEEERRKVRRDSPSTLTFSTPGHSDLTVKAKP